MASQPDLPPQLRQFLVISFRVGTREDGYLVGPTLVSTRDYKRFHYWDEPSAVVLGADDYEVVKVYPLGLSCGEAALLFAKDFLPTSSGRYRSVGWIASDGAFFSAEGWVSLGQHLVLAA